MGFSVIRPESVFHALQILLNVLRALTVQHAANAPKDIISPPIRFAQFVQPIV